MRRGLEGGWLSLYVFVCVCLQCQPLECQHSSGQGQDCFEFVLAGQGQQAVRDSLETGVGLKRAVGGQTELETEMSEQTGMCDSSALRSPARVMTGHTL